MSSFSSQLRVIPVFNVASYFIRKGIYEGVFVNSLKAQKLIYIAHGLHLAIFKEPLITSPVQAWQCGHVIPEVYDYLKYFGDKGISITTLKNPIETEDRFVSSEQKALLEKVWQAYGKKLNLEALITLTHAEGTPWHSTFWGGVYKASIPDEVTKVYYEGLVVRFKVNT